MEKRVERLRAMLAVAIALLRILQPDLTRLRIPNGSDKGRLLRALDRTRDVLGLRRVLQTIGLSPSRLFLHSLDSVAKVSSLVAFYVEEHNATIPHSAFKGQTPDEIYFGRGEVVPDQLA